LPFRRDDWSNSNMAQRRCSATARGRAADARRHRGGGAVVLTLSGTSGSNPLSSSGESGANLTSSVRAPKTLPSPTSAIGTTTKPDPWVRLLERRHHHLRGPCTFRCRSQGGLHHRLREEMARRCSGSVGRARARPTAGIPASAVTGGHRKHATGAAREIRAANEFAIDVDQAFETRLSSKGAS
jgi:hypothetical protein